MDNRVPDMCECLYSSRARKHEIERNVPVQLYERYSSIAYDRKRQKIPTEDACYRYQGRYQPVIF